MQFLRALVVPAAERRVGIEARLTADLREELPLDGVAVAGQHRAHLEIVGGTGREQAVASRQHRVGRARQRDRLRGTSMSTMRVSGTRRDGVTTRRAMRSATAKAIAAVANRAAARERASIRRVAGAPIREAPRAARLGAFIVGPS
jgi:hypothetical protein